MAPFVSLQTYLGLIGLGCLGFGIIGGILTTAYCTIQQLRRPSLYMGWLLASSILFLVTTVVAALRAFVEPGTLSPAFTSLAGPYSLCSVVYYLAEFEFGMLMSTNKDLRAERKRVYVPLLTMYVLLWSFRLPTEYGARYPPYLAIVSAFVPLVWLVVTDVIDVYIQIRMMLLIRKLFKTDEIGRRQYTVKSVWLIVLLATYDLSTIVMLTMSNLLYETALTTAEALYLINISLVIVHIIITIVLMENGRQTLITRRKASAAQGSTEGGSVRSKRKGMWPSWSAKSKIKTRTLSMVESEQAPEASSASAAYAPQSTALWTQAPTCMPPTSTRNEA